MNNRSAEADPTKLLPLLQVFLDQRGLLGEEDRVLVGVFKEAAEPFGGLVERFGELALFLIAPGGFERSHACVKAGHQALELDVEAVEVLGEATEFGRVYMGFGHSFEAPF